MDNAKLGSLSLNYVLNLANGYRASAVLFAASKIEVFEHLAESSLTMSLLASRTGTQVEPLGKMLNALVAFGLLRKENNRYTNTEVANKYLTSKSPHSLVPFLKSCSDSMPYWTHLEEKNRAPDSVPCRDEELRSNPDKARTFALGMHALGQILAPLVAEHLDTKGTERLLDVGGGSGIYSVTFALRNSHLKAVILDLPHTISVAKEVVSSSEVADRITFREGDINDVDFGAGFDMVLFSHILHGQEPEQNKELIRKAWSALDINGRAVIHDFVLDETGTSPLFSAIFNLNMLVSTEKGGVYTSAEYTSWLADAGFEQIERRDMLSEELGFETSLFIGWKR